MTKGRMHRRDATVSSGDFTMDDARQVKLERLMNLGRSEAVKKIHLDDIQQRFLNRIKVAPFVPSLGSTTVTTGKREFTGIKAAE